MLLYWQSKLSMLNHSRASSWLLQLLRRGQEMRLYLCFGLQCRPATHHVLIQLPPNVRQHHNKGEIIQKPQQEVHLVSQSFYWKGLCVSKLLWCESLGSGFFLIYKTNKPLKVIMPGWPSQTWSPQKDQSMNRTIPEKRSPHLHPLVITWIRIS